MNKKNNEKLTFLESTKIIIICISAFAMTSIPIAYLCKFLFKINLSIGIFVGILFTLFIVFITGAWKPATENENTFEEDEDEDD